MCSPVCNVFWYADMFLPPKVGLCSCTLDVLSNDHVTTVVWRSPRRIEILHHEYESSGILVFFPEIVLVNTNKYTKYKSITKTRLYNFDPLKPNLYIVKLGFTWVYIIFLYFCPKTYIVGTRSNCLAKTVLTSTHNLCFEQKYKISVFSLSQNFQFGGESFNIFEYACFRKEMVIFRICHKHDEQSSRGTKGKKIKSKHHIEDLRLNNKDELKQRNSLWTVSRKHYSKVETNFIHTKSNS